MVPTVSVLVPTRNRADQLQDSLLRILSQRPDDIVSECEVIVIDNGSTDHTATVLGRLRDAGSLTALYEPVPGKSRALNRGMEVAKGELLAFTDDDVHVSSEWLASLIRASRSFPDAAVICGPIIPEFPEDSPVWLRNHQRFVSFAYAQFNPRLPEGVLPVPYAPYGPNFCIRASALRGERFRTDLGPSSEGSFMCEDTEFIGRFRTRSERFIFVPSASVTHCIRPSLMEPRRLWERAFMLGRSLIKQDNVLRLIPPGNIIEAEEDQIRRFETGMLLSFYYGQLCQLSLHKETAQCECLALALSAVPWSGRPDELAGPAREWAANNLEYVPEPARAGFSEHLPPESHQALRKI